MNVYEDEAYFLFFVENILRFIIPFCKPNQIKPNQTVLRVFFFIFNMSKYLYIYINNIQYIIYSLNKTLFSFFRLINHVQCTMYNVHVLAYITNMTFIYLIYLMGLRCLPLPPPSRIVIMQNI